MTLALSDQLDFLYSAGETRRFHTWPVLRERTIAHHSWHVTMLLYLLYGQEEPGVRPQLLLAGLCHDAAEWKFGDLPSPAKRALSEQLDIVKGGAAIGFREAWGELEEEELAKFGLDWQHTLTDEERRKLKFCDSLEGAFYCIQERQMGNKMIEPAYLNFYNYLLEVKTDNINECEAMNFARLGWSAANER